MKIAFVFLSMPVGGAEDFALSIAKNLPPEHEAVFVCLRSLGVLGEELVEGKEVFLVPIAKSKRLNFPGIWKLAAWLKKKRINVVHSQTYNAHTYAIPAAKLAGCKAILHQQKTLQKTKLHREWILGFLARKSDAVLALSAKTREDLVDTYGLKHARVRVVPNVVDRAVFKKVANKVAARVSLGLKPNILLVGAIASLNAVKNHTATLQMCFELTKAGVEFNALILGNGNEREKLIQLIAELELTKKVSVPGAQRPIVPWLQSLDLLVMPSLWEGQPLILLQALACGIPVIASRIEGNIAALGEEHPALFNLDHPQEYTELVLRFADDPAFREEILTYQAKQPIPDAALVAQELVQIYENC